MIKSNVKKPFRVRTWKIFLGAGILGIVILLVFFGYLYLHITNDELEVSHYEISASIPSSIRIVQLSDLHNSVFGDNNCELVKAVENADPDIIVITGDMLNRDDPDTDTVTTLLKELKAIAPMYYGYGNHEEQWEEQQGKSLTPIFTEAGAIVLDYTFTDIEVNDVPIRIGGYMAYYRQPGMLTASEDKVDSQLNFPEEFENTDRYTILLNHIPTSWLDWDYINVYPVDLVFSGHYHGGQWVLPGIGAVFAPYVGFNPPYTKGIYSGTQATCVISAGLGNEYGIIPRVNNPPDLVVVDVKACEK